MAKSVRDVALALDLVTAPTRRTGHLRGQRAHRGSFAAGLDAPR